MRHDPSGKAIIVYDGACGFCRAAIVAIRRRDRASQFEYLPRQTAGIEERFPELRLGNFDAGMRLFEPDGKMHIGADAIYRITLRLPFFRWFSWMYRLPILNIAMRRVYSWIAANRLKLSRYCGDECKLEPAEVRFDAGHGSAMSGRQLVISGAILLILGLHGWANAAKALTPGSWIGDRSWPFLAYGMYRQSYSPNDVIRATKEHMTAVTAAGEELKTGPALVGLHRPGLRGFIVPMLSGDATATRLLAERVNLGRSDPVVAFRIDLETYAITETGVVSEGTRSQTYFVPE